jgi:hypothetical protein
MMRRDQAIGLDKQRTMLRAALHFARRAEIAWEKARFEGVAIVLQTLPVINHDREMCRFAKKFARYNRACRCFARTRS